MPANTGFAPVIGNTVDANQHISGTPVMDYNRWYYITMLKEGNTMTIYYDGESIEELALGGDSITNDGPLYIGQDPWYPGITGAGYDNIQIHNRALTLEEIRRAASGEILLNDNCVLALDLTGGRRNDLVLDMSNYGHNAKVMGNPTFTEGGPPLREYVAPPSTTPSYMTIDGVNDYLVIDHTDALALGGNNADFTVSFALM